MQYQTFSGNDLREALSAVRAAYGPDALIGPTRHVQLPGSSGQPEVRVEVQAAPSGGRSAWPFASALLPEAQKQSAKLPPRVKRAAAAHFAQKKEPPTLARNNGAEAGSGGGSPLSRMELQIAELRSMVEALQSQLPAKQRALALLSELGIEGNVARELGLRLGKAKSDGELLDKIRQRLLRALPEAINPLTSGQRELIACVGATGVGKTTTLAKIAAQGRLEHGRSVAIISLDHFRVGATDQWMRYGKLMGIPVFVPRSAQELEEVLSTNNADLLLVDTPSVGSSQDGSMKAFAQLAHKAKRQTHVLLLLPAWLRGNDAEGLVQRYEHLSPTGLVVTKLDETAGLGGVVQASIASQLPITYLSRGPRVPEHLDAANCAKIVEAALDRVEPAVH